MSTYLRSGKCKKELNLNYHLYFIKKKINYSINKTIDIRINKIIEISDYIIFKCKDCYYDLLKIICSILDKIYIIITMYIPTKSILNNKLYYLFKTLYYHYNHYSTDKHLTKLNNKLFN